MGFTKATSDYLDAGGIIKWITTPKTAGFTAVAGEGYFVNTTSAAITVTLPSNPSAGDEVTIVDYAGTADTNNINITSSDNINGATNDVSINYERGGVSIVYVDATQGWIVYNAANETATALNPPSVSVDYLVVAGGGGGGTRFGGGGGAGGLRTNYGGTALTITSFTNYTVTIGAGGADGAVSGGPGTSGANDGSNGQNSVFSTITANGGGGGGAGDQRDGLDGGSGGGGAGRFATTGGASTGTNQGNAGGSASGAQSGGAYVGAGGGGAGVAGGTAQAGGAGGSGLAVNIINTTNAGIASVGEVSGSDVYFSGGGGGGTESGGTLGPGGSGGGGTGGYNTTATSGTSNTGGGGGGGGYTGANAPAGAGGSGVVILRYPNDYTITVGSGITEASGSPFTEGTDKVSVFTAGTGIITFA